MQLNQLSDVAGETQIDATYAKVHFGYTDSDGQEKRVKTLEEDTYPRYFKQSSEDSIETDEALPASPSTDDPELVAKVEEKHLVFQENQRGVTFDALFGPYLKGARVIMITDPYIRLFYQARNLMELLETIARLKDEDEEIAVHLVTVEDEFRGEQQIEYFEQMQTSSASIGIHFSWAFESAYSIHARHITADNGWKILLDRGLDIFQHYDMNDAFSFSNRLQQHRACKPFEVTFLRQDLEQGG